MITALPKEKTTGASGRHSAEDLARLPETERYELLRGELIEMAPPGGEHGILTSVLAIRAGAYVLNNGLGVTTAAETGFLLARDPDTVLAPDFAFIRKGRLEPPYPKGYIALCPDLVLETVSPGDTRREIALKTEMWLRHGALMVWVLEPSRRSLTVHRPGAASRLLNGPDMLSGEDVLPGFSMPITEIFDLP